MTVPFYAQKPPDQAKRTADALENVVKLLAAINQKLEELVKARSSRTAP